jgi:hypothetical protein
MYFPSRLVTCVGFGAGPFQGMAESVSDFEQAEEKAKILESIKMAKKLASEASDPRSIFLSRGW